MRKTRVISLLLCLCMVFALLPATAYAVLSLHTLDVSVEAPVVGRKPATTGKAVHSGGAQSYVKSVTWSGELDANGCFKAGVAYTVTVTERMNDSLAGRIHLKADDPIINEQEATIVSVSADGMEATASYTFPPLQGSAEPDEDEKEDKAHAEFVAQKEAEREAAKKDVYTQTQADAAWWKLNQKELIMDGSEGGNRYFDDLNNDQLSTITRLLLDYSNPDPDYLTAEWPENYENCFHNIQEVWLSPKVDAKKFFDDLAAEAAKSYEGTYKRHSSGILNGVLTIFVPDTQLPKGLLSYSSSPMEPTYSVKVYSGDVYAAYKQGASAGKDWCPGHVYTGKIQTASRMYQNITCQRPNLWYYSCKWCGKCEYNSNHTFSLDNDGKDSSGKRAEHCFYAYDLSDKNYIGTNERGEKVYSPSCIWCGISCLEDELSYTYAQYLKDMGAADNAQSKKDYQYYMDVIKKSWAVGGASYNNVMKASVSSYKLPYAFAVAGGKDVTAKVSAWAKNEVNWAAQNDLIDAALLGSDYTKTVTRQQFCSVAVKMAEKLLGKSITPAPTGTFTDTDNIYVRKASAAGLVKGGGNGKFDPNGTLDRQQMATLIYNVLMYVKENSDIKYSIYDSKMGDFSDSKQVASWARQGMDFMTGLELMTGSGNKLSPANPCSIQEALILANRSLKADVIGWYQSLGGTEKNVTDSGVGGNKTKRCFYAIVGDIQGDGRFNQLRYRQSERFWVTGAAQTQDWITRGERAQGDYIRMLKAIDPYTGDTLYIEACNFRPIKAD